MSTCSRASSATASCSSTASRSRKAARWASRKAWKARASGARSLMLDRVPFTLPPPDRQTPVTAGDCPEPMSAGGRKTTGRTPVWTRPDVLTADGLVGAELRVDHVVLLRRGLATGGRALAGGRSRSAGLPTLGTGG